MYLLHIVISCWIETEKGAIWGFVAPMLAIIMVRVLLNSIAILFAGMYVHT